VAEIDGRVGHVRALEVAGYLFALFPRQTAAQRGRQRSERPDPEQAAGTRAPTVHSGQSAVNEFVNELLSSPGRDGNQYNNEGNDSGQQTTELC
jgi:hypothetical protein